MVRNDPFQTTLKEERDGLIQMRGITKVFKVPAGEVMVLKGIDIDFYKGEFVSVIGRSGSGKSTLVNMITGIDHPTSGSVKVADTYIHDMSEGKMAVWRGKYLGIVFQFYQLLPMLTLVENIMLPMDFCNVYPRSEREGRALKLLERVGLEKQAYKLPGAISGGQQQSVAVARALANDPPIIVADEPTGNLDSRTAEQVMQLFEEMLVQGKTIIMVTHDNTLAKLTTRSLVISDGEVIPEGVVKTFSDLPHSVMLKIAHISHPLTLKTGVSLRIEERSPAVVYAVQSGKVILRQYEASGKEVATTSYTPGNLVDPAKFLQDPLTKLELVAGGDRPVELLAFDHLEITRVLEGMSVETDEAACGSSKTIVPGSEAGT